MSVKLTCLLFCNPPSLSATPALSPFCNLRILTLLNTEASDDRFDLISYANAIFSKNTNESDVDGANLLENE